MLNEFQSILDEYVTLDSVKQAVKRAEKIVKMNDDEHKKKEVIRLIFDVCGVK